MRADSPSPRTPNTARWSRYLRSAVQSCYGRSSLRFLMRTISASSRTTRGARVRQSCRRAMHTSNRAHGARAQLTRAFVRLDTQCVIPDEFPLTTTLVPAKESKSNFRPAEVLIRATHVGAPDAGLRDAPPGAATFVPALEALAVRCADASVLLVTHIQTRGKPTRSASEWWRGFRDRADAHGRLHFE